MKLTVYSHSTGETLVHEGDEASLRTWLHGQFPWLRVEPGESLHEVLEDLNSQQDYEAELTGLGGGLGKSEEDGVAALLHLDDPRDRRLALKSRHVDPHHLRLALGDEDPEVRREAAHHPALTPELIREVLAGEDDWLREQVLTRPDLRPEDFEVLGDRPETWATASRHPALGEDLRRRWLEDPRCPEGLRGHLALEKNMAHIVYPLLGEPRVPTLPVVVDEAAAERRFRLFGSRTPAVAGADAPGAWGATLYNTRRQNPMGTEKERLAAVVVRKPGASDREVHGLEHHEAQHGVFARLKQRYGREAGFRIVATTLAALTPEEHGHLKRLADGLNIAANYGHRPQAEPEERIAYLYNYMMDPTMRRKVHINLRIHNDVAAQRELQGNVRKVWEKLRRRAASLRPEEVGVSLQKDQEVLAAYAEGLRKSRVELESIPVEDHLGLDVALTAYISAARFLTGKDVAFAEVRRRLRQTGDIRQAVADAFGLDSDDRRKALDAVLRIRDARKSAAEAPKDVQALLPGGADVADDVRAAFGSGEVQPVKFGGRHSGGMMIARDPDGVLWLLKPGSGGQSPAAGARQEAAGQSRREACFAAVANAWGLGSAVPRCEVLALDGREVAALRMLPLSWQSLARAAKVDPNLPHRALGPYRERGVMHRWAVLDYVLGNPDRHGQNLMVSSAADGSRLALIDHGSAFAGTEFDPAHDENSFVPYYLRVWVPDWEQKTDAERLAALPKLPEPTDVGLRTWLLELDPDRLAALLQRHGIDAAPSVARLRRLQDACRGSSAAAAVNAAWVS